MGHHMSGAPLVSIPSIALFLVVSPPCVSNPSVGLLDGDGLDAIYHVIELVLLGFDPYYPLCSKIDVAMTLLRLMLVTRA